MLIKCVVMSSICAGLRKCELLTWHFRCGGHVYVFYFFFFASASRSNSRGGGTNNLPPLLFHNVHGENIRISRDGTVARRAESFCKGIAFSSRPVKVNEKVGFICY